MQINIQLGVSNKDKYFNINMIINIIITWDSLQLKWK